MAEVATKYLVIAVVLAAGFLVVMTAYPGQQAVAAPNQGGGSCPANCDSSCWVVETNACALAWAGERTDCGIAKSNCELAGGTNCTSAYNSCLAAADQNQVVCMSQRAAICC
jgi:hypothetical protein